MNPFSGLVAVGLEKCLERVRLLGGDGGGEVDGDGGLEVAKLGGEVVQRHALALDHERVPRPGDEWFARLALLGADCELVAIQVNQGPLEAEQRLLERDAQLDCQVVAVPAEERVPLLPQREHHAPGDLLGLLLRHALENELLPVGHAALNDSLDRFLLLRALLLRKNFLLLLHHHATSHRPENCFDLVRAASALCAALASLRSVRAPATAADDAALDPRRDRATFVHVIQADVQRHLEVGPARPS
mmetsp:Transcript_5746/g.13749  ORF Transcript_5746/g.13749 Transcript_5746/m.13749 type:complete len:246 (+) Transcript_5746:281-1018(+)